MQYSGLRSVMGGHWKRPRPCPEPLQIGVLAKQSRFRHSALISSQIFLFVTRLVVCHTWDCLYVIRSAQAL